MARTRRIRPLPSRNLQTIQREIIEKVATDVMITFTEALLCLVWIISLSPCNNPCAYFADGATEVQRYGVTFSGLLSWGVDAPRRK